MSRYVVKGGVPLQGSVEAAANKNAVLPIMAATLLTDDECVLTNVPQITDVVVMGKLLRELGARVDGLGSKEIRICCANVRESTLNPHLVKKMRAAVTLLAPLLARRGHVRTNYPGGCVIGRRDIGTHLDALSAMGAHIGEIDDDYDITADRLVGASIFLDEASVTATENTVMAAVLASGRTTIKHAACEPHVEDFCRFLVKMGAQIGGIGSNIILVDGVPELHGAVHRISTGPHRRGTLPWPQPLPAAMWRSGALCRSTSSSSAWCCAGWACGLRLAKGYCTFCPQSSSRPARSPPTPGRGFPPTWHRP